MNGREYATPVAMRAALEQRLLARSRSTRLPLDRLRKEAAVQRLLARIALEAPAGSWALKGGIVMIARVGERARATSDADATWRTDEQTLYDMLDRASVLDLNDNFEFIIGRGKRIQAEGPQGGLRFPVTARMASKEFEALRLDVNLVDHDPRPIEEVTLRNLLDFAGISPVTVPAIRPEQQLAEKLHAYTRDYGSKDNGRSKDLYDMLVIVEELTLPPIAGLVAACRQTFALRATSWRPTLGPPPESWVGPWEAYVADYGIQYGSLADAYEALTAFWQPVLEETPPGAVWNADIWSWS
jgi:hypothetical protein